MTQGPETVRIGVSKFGDLHIHSRGEPLDGFPDQPEYIRADVHAAEVARLREAAKIAHAAMMKARSVIVAKQEHIALQEAIDAVRSAILKSQP